MNSLASQLSRPPQIYYWIQTFLIFSDLQRFRIRKINQTGKYEAGQTFHSANILVAPPRPPKPSCRRHVEVRTYL